MRTYTVYQEKIRGCFAVAYKFFDQHKEARTEEDWTNIIEGVACHTDSFTKDLLIAVFNEIEREYNRSTQPQGKI